MNVTTHPSPPKISLLHATRGRPVQAVECRERWFRLAKSPESVEHLFAVDWDDAPSLQGLAAFSPLVVNDRDGGCVAAWNLVASHSTGEILVQLSDDWVPPQDWDQLIRQAVGDSSKSCVLRVSDGHRTDDLFCMAILTKARLHEQGFFFSPEYQGVYSDDEFSFRAHKDGVVIQAPEICFTHEHPHYDTAVTMDQTYLVQNSEVRKRGGLLVFAKRNPDAFGRWLHRGTDLRRYRAEAELHEVQYQFVEAVNERVRLLEKQDELVGAVRQLNEHQVALEKSLKSKSADLQALQEVWSRECDALRRVHQALSKEHKKLRDDVEKWNKRSWFKRAFHKLRLEKKSKTSFGNSGNEKLPDEHLAVFDAAHYLRENPDVAAGGADPLIHYKKHGWKKGRSPHPFFDPKWFKKQYPEVANGGRDILSNFLQHGWKWGRNPHPMFDTRFFLEHNRALIRPGQNPLAEYQRLLADGKPFEIHPQFSRAWINEYLFKTSDKDLKTQAAPIPGAPEKANEARAFAKLEPVLSIGMILYQTSEEDLIRMVRALDLAVKAAVAAGFKRPLITFTDNSHQWNEEGMGRIAKLTGVEVRFFATEENIGFGRGHNHLMWHGFRDLGATHYFCLNPDGYLHPDALVELYRAVKLCDLPAFIEARQFPSEHPKDYDAETLETNWNSAGCLVIPKFLFDLTGGFDDHFFMYCEDVDLSWRVWELGYRCLVAPKAHFHHIVASRTHNPRAEKQSLESGRILAEKWGVPRFRLACEKLLIERNHYKNTDQLPLVPKLDKRTPNLHVDFTRMFGFAPFRW